MSDINDIRWYRYFGQYVQNLLYVKYYNVNAYGVMHASTTRYSLSDIEMIYKISDWNAGLLHENLSRVCSISYY